MFIEVYSIPVVNWNQPAIDSAVEANKRLIQLNQIKNVTHSSKCEGRAELEMVDGGKITVVGSYHDILNRIGWGRITSVNCTYDD